jgi:ankyrin repeat protein
VEAIKTLVQLGADKDAKASNGWRPLHVAAANGHVEAIKVLVQLGADKDAKNANGDTPLHFAAFNGHVEAIKALEQLGAQIDACAGCRRRDTPQDQHPPRSTSGGAGVAGAGTHRTHTQGGG